MRLDRVQVTVRSDLLSQNDSLRLFDNAEHTLNYRVIYIKTRGNGSIGLTKIGSSKNMLARSDQLQAFAKVISDQTVKSQIECSDAKGSSNLLVC